MQKLTTMKLNPKTKQKREHGDVKAIHEATKLSTTTISNALNSGKGSRKTILLIEKFYQEL